MRVTGGVYRGRRITCPPGVIRPAMDRMRESMFSILGPIEGLSFLDLFSGSGLVGIEAASRGCEPVDLVEMDRRKRSVLRQNMEIVETQINLYMMSVQKFVRLAPRSYDIMYADPPFPMEGKEKLSLSIAQSQLLRPDGLYIIHYPAEDNLPERMGKLMCSDTRKYGRSMLKFYREDTHEQL
jgi:16S rRNA (guanine(966)-N(2))-methyltransferase RsmD